MRAFQISHAQPQSSAQQLFTRKNWKITSVKKAEKYAAKLLQKILKKVMQIDQIKTV